MQRKLVLASASPRRKELLTQAGFSFEILAANADERIDEREPEELVKKLSERKAGAAMEMWKREQGTAEDVIVLGADTIVVKDHRILGKPADREEAASMLRCLQGDRHSVYTGVTLFWLDAKRQLEEVSFVEKTDVTFYPMTEMEIQAYIGTGECDDKAGAYAVQGIGMKYIQKVDGDYHNVVGLPVGRLYQELKKIIN